MLTQIALFELRYQLRQPLFWLTSLLFAVLTFGAMTTDSVMIGGSVGNVHRNAPIVILQFLGTMSVIGVFVTTAFVATAIHRDFANNTHELFFSRPIRKRDYLLGRLSGSLVVGLGVFLFTALGIVVGTQMPWLEPERLAPFSAAPYLHALGVIVIPNLLFTGLIFFAVASVTRSMFATYIAVVVFFIGYAVSGLVLGELDNDTWASLMDPFAMSALASVTKYWTVAERNSSLPEISGLLLWNRALWMSIGLAIFAYTYRAFSYTQQTRRRRARASEDAGSPPATTGPGAELLPAVHRVFTPSVAWGQFWHQARIEAVSVLRGAPFLVILAFGMFNLIISSGFYEVLFGTSVLPVTHLMLKAVEGSFAFLLIIIITFYAGELVWKERAVKLDGVFDALPVPTWIPLAAKLVALVAVIGAFMIVGVLCTLGIQIYRGYYHFEPGLYLRGALIVASIFVLIAVLAVFLQVVANHKMVGYLLMILYLISAAVFAAMGWQDHLLLFASRPDPLYSDMNGYGHFVAPLFWFTLYWALGAVLLLMISALFWVRGSDSGLALRLRLARQRFRGPIRLASALALAGFLAVGGFIYYNTHVLEDYIPDDLNEERSAQYEKKYRQYRTLAQPRITDVEADVDIHPGERRVEIRGRYVVKNRTSQPIPAMHFNIPTRVAINQLVVGDFRVFPGAHGLSLVDEELGYYIHDLAEPLAPGQELTLSFDLTVSNPGFVNHGDDNAVVGNGTFFNNRQYFPLIGYNESMQLIDRNTRREHGLPPVQRVAKIDDEDALGNNYVISDADWISFATTVSTDPDQIAIAPGYLKREWTENGRRYFRYEMDSPILAFFAYLSAAYEVKRDRWNDVAIEIYHHPGHDYNVDRMIDGIKKSLEYFSANFSPFQHRQMRIIEFPRYAQFAQSFPNTVPFSEGIGFIADLRDDDAIDYVFYVTAHEVAHQWWAHQVIGGRVQGATMLSETLSQYSALMVMEKEYGREKMRRFLRHELDDYLGGRGGELVEELPLMLVENQPYIHYNKGSVVLYALRDYIGEEAVNRALAGLIAEHGFKGPPYPRTTDLLRHLRPMVPENLPHLIEDLFETITLFDNRMVEATYRERDDGAFVVDMKVTSRKLRADGQGAESEVAIDDWIDVAVFGDDSSEAGTDRAPLYLEKHHITGEDTHLEIVVAERPARAGIDPYNKLVDRNSGDNVKRVTASE